MVLETLISPRKAERDPWKMFFIGVFYSSLAVLLSMWIFPRNEGMTLVLLTVLGCIHIVHRTLREEETKDINSNGEARLLKEHAKALSFLMFLFLGFIVSYSLWYIFLPSHTADSIFSVQKETIEHINAMVSGSVSFENGNFAKIVINNLGVLFFTLLFAFFYGAGVVFILSWNASVIGVAMGNFARTNIAAAANLAGNVSLGSYFSIYSLSIMRYLTHGAVELLAYIIAAFAAGIISIAVARHDVGSKNFNRLLLDTTGLIALSVLLLALAAFVEVYITPVLV